MGANDTQVGGDHYQNTTWQHWDWAWQMRLDSFQYPITKYIARWKFKNGFEDLDKAKHYLVKYLEVLGDNDLRVCPAFRKETHNQWALASSLDIQQTMITGLVANWRNIKELEQGLAILERYIEEQEEEHEPG